MGKFLFLVALGLSIASCAQAAPTPDYALTEAHRCVKPWLNGLDQIITINPATPDAETFRKILGNSPYVRAVTEDGRQGVQFLSEVKDESTPWVALLPFCTEPTDSIWKSNQGFIGQYYGEPNVLVVRNSIEVPNLLRGLILLHEMRHALQKHAGDASLPALHREEDAYEYEFSILDSLDLPEYDAFLADEIIRIREEVTRNGAVGPNPTDPRILSIFPGPGMDGLGRDVAASELFIRAMFKFYEQSDPAHSSAQKRHFLTLIGYKD